MDAYRYQVNFEKVFQSGILKGRRYTNAWLRFTDWHSANAFAQDCDGKTITTTPGGGTTYTRECPILTAIEECYLSAWTYRA